MFIKKLLVVFIKLYQKYFSLYFNVIFSSNCRFYPTCSEYSCVSIEKYGVVKGVMLSIKRIIKCNPLGGLGYDPVK